MKAFTLAVERIFNLIRQCSSCHYAHSAVAGASCLAMGGWQLGSLTISWDLIAVGCLGVAFAFLEAGCHSGTESQAINMLFSFIL